MHIRLILRLSNSISVCKFILSAAILFVYLRLLLAINAIIILRLHSLSSIFSIIEHFQLTSTSYTSTLFGFNFIQLYLLSVSPRDLRPTNLKVCLTLQTFSFMFGHPSVSVYFTHVLLLILLTDHP